MAVTASSSSVLVYRIRAETAAAAMNESTNMSGMNQRRSWWVIGLFTLQRELVGVDAVGMVDFWLAPCRRTRPRTCGCSPAVVAAEVKGWPPVGYVAHGGVFEGEHGWPQL